LALMVGFCAAIVCPWGLRLAARHVYEPVSDAEDGQSAGGTWQAKSRLHLADLFLALGAGGTTYEPSPSSPARYRAPETDLGCARMNMQAARSPPLQVVITAALQHDMSAPPAGAPLRPRAGPSTGH
jgi:hypothetical protein